MGKPDEVSWPVYIRKLIVKFLSRSFQRYKRLHIAGKIVVWIFILFNVAVATLFITMGPKRLAQNLYDLSQKLANHPYGWLILGSVMVVTSFPPLIGYSTCVSLCGFAYGLKGFLLAAPGTLIGACAAFVVLRLLFRRKLRNLTSRNEKWQALESVVKAKGLPLIILIRASPFPPWVYANAWLASIETVKLWQFFVATIFVLPKIFLSVFIGSRIAAFSDGKQREHMDKNTAIVNAASIAVGVLLALGMSFTLFRLVQRQIAEMQQSSDIDEELAAEAIEEGEEGAPLLLNYSDEALPDGTNYKNAANTADI